MPLTERGEGKVCGSSALLTESRTVSDVTDLLRWLDPDASEGEPCSLDASSGTVRSDERQGCGVCICGTRRCSPGD